MNKLEIGLGGHNLTGDDILFLQTNLTDAITALAKTTGKALIAIHGVDLTFPGATIAWTAGWLYINGELCQVDAGSAAYPANNTFVIQQTVDTLGNQTYEDLTAQTPYKVRKATISGNAGGTNIQSNLAKLSDFLLTDVSAWLSLNAILTGGSSWVGVNGASNVVGYRLSRSRVVELNGEVSTSNYQSATDTVIATLPAGYRPGKKLTFLCPASVGGTRTTLHVEVDITGAITPLGLSNGNNVNAIFFNNIRFDVDWSGII